MHHRSFPQQWQSLIPSSQKNSTATTVRPAAHTPTSPATSLDLRGLRDELAIDALPSHWQPHREQNFAPSEIPLPQRTHFIEHSYRIKSREEAAASNYNRTRLIYAPPVAIHPQPSTILMKRSPLFPANITKYASVHINVVALLLDGILSRGMGFVEKCN